MKHRVTAFGLFSLERMRRQDFPGEKEWGLEIGRSSRKDRMGPDAKEGPSVQDFSEGYCFPDKNGPIFSVLVFSSSSSFFLKCLELKQLFCNYKGKVKRISEMPAL